MLACRVWFCTPEAPLSAVTQESCQVQALPQNGLRCDIPLHPISKWLEFWRYWRIGYASGSTSYPFFRVFMSSQCWIFYFSGLCMCSCAMQQLLLYLGASQKMAWRLPSRWITWGISTLFSSFRTSCAAQPQPVLSWSPRSPIGGLEVSVLLSHLLHCTS